MEHVLVGSTPGHGRNRETCASSPPPRRPPSPCHAVRPRDGRGRVVQRRGEALHGDRSRARRRQLRHLPGRVRVPRRPVGLRQVDDDEAADQGGRPDGGGDPRRRPRPREDPARPRPVLPPQPRRGLPGLQAAAEPDGLRERRLRAPGHRRRPARDPRQGARHPAPHRPLDQAPSPPASALRRRAAARQRGARIRQPPALADRRRADRQSRSRDLDRDHAAALSDQPDRLDGAGGHPRRGDGRQDAPARDRARRRPRRARRAGRRLCGPREHARVRAAHAERPGMRPVFFLREALRALKRNAVPSFAAMATVLVTVLVLGVFIPVVQATTGAANEVRNKVIADVYLKTNATQKDIDRVQRLIQQQPTVKSVQFVSKKQAYAEEKKRNPEAYQLLGSNPLPDTFRVTPAKPDDITKLRDALAPQSPAGGPAVVDPAIDEVRNREEDTNKILSVTRVVKITMALLAGVLGIASILLIANTIRLSLYARRREVEVMKLVGATDWFIRWPFVLEGVIVGALGGVLAILLLGVAKVAVVDPLAKDFALISSPDTIHFPLLIAILLLAAIAVSALGSGLSLRRFLRV